MPVAITRRSLSRSSPLGHILHVGSMTRRILTTFQPEIITPPRLPPPFLTPLHDLVCMRTCPQPLSAPCHPRFMLVTPSNPSLLPLLIYVSPFSPANSPLLLSLFFSFVRSLSPLPFLPFHPFHSTSSLFCPFQAPLSMQLPYLPFFSSKYPPSLHKLSF